MSCLTACTPPHGPPVTARSPRLCATLHLFPTSLIGCSRILSASALNPFLHSARFYSGPLQLSYPPVARRGNVFDQRRTATPLEVSSTEKEQGEDKKKVQNTEQRLYEIGLTVECRLFLERLAVRPSFRLPDFCFDLVGEPELRRSLTSV